jgi:transcriptional regulator with XRE-family HTH domain
LHYLVKTKIIFIHTYSSSVTFEYRVSLQNHKEKAGFGRVQAPSFEIDFGLMPKPTYISPQDRTRFREIMAVLNLRQDDIVKAEGMSFSASWLSQVLTGARTSVDSEKLHEFVQFLRKGLSNDEVLSRAGQDVVAAAKLFLSNFAPDQAASSSQPGLLIEPEDPNYFEKTTDNLILKALEKTPFLMRVRGPVQSGKTSLLAQVANRAQEKGIETLWFDPDPTGMIDPNSPNWTEEANEVTSRSLCELLQFEWGLPAPHDDPNSVPRLALWLRSSLGNRERRLRLLIIDDLGSLGASAAYQWLKKLILPVGQNRLKLNLSIAIGLSNPWGPDFHNLLDVSSSPVFFPVPDVGWLEKIEPDSHSDGPSASVWEECLDRIGPIFMNLGGQPYLTHAAAVDGDFRQIVESWDGRELGGEAASRLKATPYYRRHLQRIKRAIIGPTVVPSKSAERLIAKFADLELHISPDEEQYLQGMKLVDFLGNQRAYPAQIYRLMAWDLNEAVARHDNP